MSRRVLIDGEEDFSDEETVEGFEWPASFPPRSRWLKTVVQKSKQVSDDLPTPMKILRGPQ